MKKEEFFENIFMINGYKNYALNDSEKKYVIIYPTDGYYLTKKQFDALYYALTINNYQTNAINIETEMVNNDSDFSKLSWRVLKNLEYSEYTKELIVLENGLIDEDLHWSINIFQDYWAILYGDKQIVESFCKRYDVLNDKRKFVEDILSNINSDHTIQKYQEIVNNTYCSKLHK